VAIVPSPPATAPPHSLVRAADTTRDADADWQKGLAYAPETPGGYIARASMNCAPDADDVDHLRPLVDAVDYAPWEVQFHDPCETTFGYRGQDVTDRLRRIADATESYAIARELWTGELATAAGLPNASLTGSAPDVLAGGAAVSPRRGLGLLEEAVGDALMGQQAFIHCARAARPYLWELVKQGNLLFTNLDNAIVCDAGYPGSAPAGQPDSDTDDVAWIYATGPVVVRRSELLFFSAADAEVIDTRTNTRYRTASKLVAATFDPSVLFAVPVTLS
jgi:hypothetical protein